MATKRSTPRRVTQHELDKVDVELIGGNEAVKSGRIHLSCRNCGSLWSPNLLRGGHMPRGWWKCPRGCNY